MTEWPTLVEWVSICLVLSGLGLACWSIVDDIADLDHVRAHGVIGGPRWVAATEHFWTSLSFLLAWLCLLGLLGIAIYLPARGNVEQDALAQTGGWLRLGFSVFVLIAQVHRRVGRSKLRALPVESWERMLLMMFDGLTVVERESLSLRLLHATSAGRQMGHLILSDISVPVGLIDLTLATAVLTAEERADLEEAKAHLLGMADRVVGLHQEIRAQERGNAPEGV